MGRRHSTGFGYIGFGNNQNTFNQSSKKPFSKYKEKLDLEAHLHYEMDFLHKNLTKEDKQKIKDKIRKQERIVNKRTAILTLFLFALLSVSVFHLISQIMSR
ncbi:MAG: hypothetical protein HKP48_02925 [Winogradskyella sp.]|uniref:hypothetical protein n=1 Tax=Winogradskyella sp. TaxID=1883156 RepID=UPI00178D7FF0|nr:hypothetical protein [Winogradskyella sp.]MBT8243858.1 hypothetical protein [Winogradskyella sp.]NNK22263.1 hypothetical protein [Winogradskyella sp.]